ncbi:MAG: hypothetical protein KDK91_03570 [Gammaproteobacteria bacterium]|nr:hypothetical protein [Gammaproteobacteria bacterium]
MIDELDLDPALLSAYVDGELDPLQAADIARAVARDPRLAARVALLAHLKATVSQSPRAPSLPTLAVPAREQSRRLTQTMRAMILLVSVLLSADAPHSEAGWLGALSAAQRMHRAWQPSESAPASAAPTLAALLRRVHAPQGVVPDLQDVGLSIDDVRYESDPARVHVGYLGVRGCRVSLVMFADPTGFPQTMQSRRLGSRTVHAWRAHHIGVVLLGERMPASRLRTIAAVIQEHVRTLQPLDADGRALLLASRKSALPCMV